MTRNSQHRSRQSCITTREVTLALNDMKRTASSACANGALHSLLPARRASRQNPAETQTEFHVPVTRGQRSLSFFPARREAPAFPLLATKTRIVPVTSEKRSLSYLPARREAPAFSLLATKTRIVPVTSETFFSVLLPAHRASRPNPAETQRESHGPVTTRSCPHDTLASTVPHTGPAYRPPHTAKRPRSPNGYEAAQSNGGYRPTGYSLSPPVALVALIAAAVSLASCHTQSVKAG